MVLRSRPINELFQMNDFASLSVPSSISGSISSQRSYGATRAGLDNTETKFVVHFVDATDTLQRVAIKYGVSVENLKRVNKIWSNESLFLLEKIKIPLAAKQSHWDDSESDGEEPETEKCGDEKRLEMNKNGIKGSEQTDMKATRIKDSDNGEDKKYNSCHDFLTMIDSRIDKCKKEWTKIRSHSENSPVPFVSYDSNNANKLSPTHGYQELTEQI